MILLNSTTDALEIVTTTAADLVVYSAYMDAPLPITSSSSVTQGRTLTAIASATTTTVTAAPGASTSRNIKNLNIRNKHATLSNDVTVQIDISGTNYELVKITLRPGETLYTIDGVQWFTVEGPSAPPPNYSTTDQTASAADTYLAGSAIIIPPTRPLAIGTIFRWRLNCTKTAAGVVAPIWSMRFGTAGTTADTSRVTFTQVAAQTGAADAASFGIDAIVRGPIGASGIVAASLEMHHVLATTGFSTLNHNVQQVTSAAFDVTTSGMIVGLSVNPGTAGAWTFQVVTADVLNL